MARVHVPHVSLGAKIGTAVVERGFRVSQRGSVQRKSEHATIGAWVNDIAIEVDIAI